VLSRGVRVEMGGDSCRVIPLQCELGRESALALESDAIRASWGPYRDAHVRGLEVCLDAIQPLARTVIRRRLWAAHLLVEALTVGKVDLFESLVAYSEAGVRVLFPPVLEETIEGTFLVMDGMHRILAVRERRREKIFALAVRSPGLPPPPLMPCRWEDVQQVDQKPSSNVNFPGYKPHLFRATASHLDGNGGPFDALGFAVASLAMPSTKYEHG